MSTILKYGLITLLIIGLVAVRAFLEPLFYDPLNVYFQNDYLSTGFPELDNLKYFTHITLGFTINSILF